jgi:hypothetical protein
MSRTLSSLLAGALALVMIANSAHAQTTVTTTVTVNVPEVLRLDITGAANFTLDATAFDGGLTSVVVDASTQPTVSVTANRNWQLNAQADAATWSYAGAHAAQSPAKDASDLTVGLTGPASWTIAYDPSSKWSLGTTSETLASGGRGRTSGAIAYSLAHNLADWPGSYTLSVTYTLAGN